VRPALSDVRAARERLRGHVVRTGLLRFADDIWLKSELAQPTGSFKVRGVMNWALGLSAEERARGFSTFSAGNTALALAHASRQFGVICRSLLPDYAPAFKVESLKRAGVEAKLVPFSEMARWLFSAAWRNEPWAFLHPWTEPAMIAGHGTIGLEILKDLPDVGTVYVPKGGGALVCGVAAALKALLSGVRIVAVETESYPALSASLAAGRPVWITPRPTVCDGVAVPFVTDAMFPLLRELVDEVAVVSEERVKDAMLRLEHEAGLAVEGAGALALAAALAGPARRGPRVCLVTGGNA